VLGGYYVGRYYVGGYYALLRRLNWENRQTFVTTCLCEIYVCVRNIERRNFHYATDFNLEPSGYPM